MTILWTRDKKEKQPFPFLKNKDIAEKLKISVRQVQRLKKEV